MFPSIKTPLLRTVLLTSFFLLQLSLQSVAQSWNPGEETRLVGKDESVSVSPGQSLYDIARAHAYALEHLAEANNLPVSLAAVSREKVLIPSRRIVPLDPPKNGLVVNLPERGFYLFREGEQPRFFPIAIGEPGRFQTPTGRFSIREKIKDPPWIAPEWAGLGEDNVIPAGPDNPLGDRWIGLSASGVGIHGTNNPSSIGSATSHGCMRMYPEVVRRVFDLVEVGWPATIEYKTSRVSIEKDGIYLTCFPDPYGSVDRKRQLRERFLELDLGGFYHLIDAEALLSRPTGVCTKVVDLEPRVAVGGETFAAARIGEKLYIEGASLEKAGVKSQFNLADQTVKLSSGDKQFSLGIRFHDAEESAGDEAFLSRGAAWYPAKKVLQSLSLPYQWDGSVKQVRIDKSPVEVE